MGRNWSESFVSWLAFTLVLEITLWQAVNTQDADSTVKPVLQHCNLTTKATVLFPFNKDYHGQEALRGTLQVTLENTKFASGIDGESEGAIELEGNQGSYIEIAPDAQVDFKQSMTMLIFIQPFSSHTGPIVHYNVDMHGVQMWTQGTVGSKGGLMARFNLRELASTDWLIKDVINVGQWNFIGASYDHLTGMAALYHDGKEVLRRPIGKDDELATQFEIRIGAVAIPGLGSFHGKVACLQFYSKALSVHEVAAAKDACKQVVPLEFLSLNLTTPLVTAEVNETTLNVGATVNDNATGTIFRFDYGDETGIQESTLNTGRHMYHRIGNFTLQVTAWSLCNTSTRSEIANVSVPKPVRILKNVSLYAEATVLGEATRFRLRVGQGTDFMCCWLFGDSVNYSTPVLSLDTVYLNHTYSVTANYTAHVTCENRRSYAAAKTTLSVQTTIKDLRILPVPPILFGTKFRIEWVTNSGSDVLYTAKISGSPLLVVKSADERRGHAWVTVDQYKIPGEFSVQVTASNAVTEPISASVGFQVARAVVAFRPVVFHQDRDIEIHETVTVWVTDVNLDVAINATYLVDFGDNSNVEVTQETRIAHAYSSHGNYTVNVTAANQVSRIFASIAIEVHKPVLKLEIASLASNVAALNKLVNISMLLIRGSDFVCRWNFGDGEGLVQDFQDELVYFKGSDPSTLQLTNINISVSHVYHKVGVYKVNATCQNRLSEVRAEAQATVQEEIKLFRVSSIDPVTFGKNFSINWTIAAGTNVSFKAFLGQQELFFQREETYYISMVTQGIYGSAGKYDVTVTAVNLVTPLLRQTQEVLIEIPVSRVHINASYLEAGRLHPGHGVKMNAFPTGVPVVFKAVTGGGSNLGFSWKVSGVTGRFQNETAKYTFNEAGMYQITATVENHISQVTASTTIAVQKRASFLHGGLLCSSPNSLKDTVKTRVNIELPGTNSTLVVTLENYTKYFYGALHDYEVLNETMEFGGELKKTIVINHVFKTPGFYKVNASLANDVSKSLLTCDVEILPRPCKTPTVKLKRVGRIAEEARTFYSSDPIEIKTIIDMFCPESKQSKFLWKISRYDPGTEEFEPYDDVFADDDAFGPELRLKRRTLPVGLFKLSFTVSLVEEELKDYKATAEGFIAIRSSYLVAKISGGSEIRRGMGTIIVADGLGSYDPDVGSGNHTGMVFTWLCRNVLENFPEPVLDFMNVTADTRSDLLGFSTSSAAGCYRDGQYVLSNATSLNLTTERLLQNDTYQIILVIRKDRRTSLSGQIVELGPENIPELTIRCAVNCAQKVNPSEKFSLTTDCKGSSCSEKLIYSWSLFVSELQGDGTPLWQRSNVTTMGNSSLDSLSNLPNIIIPMETFEGNKHYKMDFKGHLPNGSYGRASYTFYVNDPPSRGSCNVQPRVGHVLTTQFKFWCADWLDSDAPLMYEFARVQENKESLLYYGDESNTTVELPLGGVSNNYTLHIVVRVSDRFGASAVVKLQVQSLPPLLEGTDLMAELSNMTSGDSSALQAFLKSGKSQDAARVVSSISSLLNQQAGDATEGSDALVEKRKEVRTSMILMMSQQKATSQQSVRLVSRSLSQATEYINEVSLQAQEACTSALTNMAVVLDRESGSDSVENSAAGMYGAIGNLLGAAADTASVNQENGSETMATGQEDQADDTKSKRSKSKSLVKNLLNILDSVATSVLRRKLPFEEATEFSTPRLTASLKSSTLVDVAGVVSAGFASFKLPQGNEMFHKEGSELTSVNQKVFSMPRNIFTYHESSRDITSPTVSLSYTNKDSEQSIPVSNLKNYIEYFLPAPSELPQPEYFSINLTENSWAYHKLLTHSEDEAISIELVPFNCSHKLQLFVKENSHPTKESFGWKKVIWRPSSEHATNAEYTRCFEDYSSYTLFLSNKDIRKSTYLIGVWYEDEGEERVVPNKNVLVKYAIRVYRSKCLFWSEREEKWMGDGCVVGPLTSTQQIHCMTNHLTSFGSGMFVAPNPIDFRKVIQGFAVAFKTGNVTVLFTILTLLLIYTVLAIWARRRDKKDGIQIGATVLPLSEQNCQYRYEISFITGSRNGSGTTAHVGCEIIGENGASDACYLVDPKRPLFRRGDLNVFIAYLPQSVGVIRGLRVWHDNSGKQPAWFLNRAMVHDCQTEEKYLFLAARWLSVTEEDGKVDVNLRPANEEDMVSFKKLFNTRLRKGICDKHLWFSVAYRPARSPFTRLQRLSCCLSLLFTFMVATAMFFGSGPQPGDASNSVKLGPITLNWRMVIIGVQSALVAIPVNILIVAFFRNSRAKERRLSQERRDFCGSVTSQESQFTTDSDASDAECGRSVHDNEHDTDLNDIECLIEGDNKNQEGSHEEPGNAGISSYEEHRVRDEKAESLEDDEIHEEETNPGLCGRLRAKLASLGGSGSPCFPYWCVYVGWALCIFTTVVSAAFTLFYSMMWGKEKSELWLTTMVISFVQDTLISQPIKVLIIAMVFALIIKSPDDEDELDVNVAAMESDEDPSHGAFYQDSSDEQLKKFRPPDEKILKATRIRELKRRDTIKLFTDLCVYVVLLTMIMILSVQYRNPESYRMIESLRRVFTDPIHNSSRVRFHEVNRVSSIWDWTRQTLLPSLFPEPLYRGHHSDPYLADRMSLQLGVARLRQVRVEKGTCDVNLFFKDLISECNDFYSFTKEDTKFYLPQWKNPTEKPAKKDDANVFSFLASKSDYNHTPWEHMNAFEAHHVLPNIGRFGTYNGGGYTINFNDSLDQSESIVHQQQQLSWLDRYTRAVHAEFVAYNPAINMVAAVTITFEIPPLGAVFKGCEVFTLSLYGSLRKHPAARTVGEIIAVIVLIFMIFRVALTLFHDKHVFFKDVSKVLDLLLVLTGVVIVFLKVLREGFKMLATDQFKNESTNQFLDFYQCGFYDELTDYALAFLDFIAIIRFSVFLKFLGCMEHLLKTMSRCLYEFLACVVVFFCLMMAYISLFTLAFEADSNDYKDLSSSVQTLLSYMARMVRSKEVQDSHKLLQDLVVFSCCVTLIFFYRNMLRAVFIEAHKKTLMEDAGKEKGKTFESGIIEIFVDKFLEVTGMEKNQEEPAEEEEDIHEVRLRSQEKYVCRSQFVRLGDLINIVYTEDVVDDVEFFQYMFLPKEGSTELLPSKFLLASPHPSSGGDTETEIQRENNQVYEELPDLGMQGFEKGILFKEGDDNGKKEKSHVKFNLAPDINKADKISEHSETPRETRDTSETDRSSSDNQRPENKTSFTPKDDEKLTLLEKLVQEKMKDLEHQQRNSPEGQTSGSLEHEIQMLVNLQQRIRTKKQHMTKVALPLIEERSEENIS